eukprot:2515890-Prymnesium_polylepis.1
MARETGCGSADRRLRLGWLPEMTCWPRGSFVVELAGPNATRQEAQNRQNKFEAHSSINI